MSTSLDDMFREHTEDPEEEQHSLTRTGLFRYFDAWQMNRPNGPSPRALSFRHAVGSAVWAHGGDHTIVILAGEAT